MDWPLYLILVNIYLILFYAFYALVLQNETFFKWNRIFLVSSASLSFLIPFIQSDWIRSLLVPDEFVKAKQIINPIALQEVQISSVVTPQNLSILDLLFLVYLSGVIVFSIKFIWQLAQVSKSFQKSNQAQSFFRKIKVSDNLPSRDTIIKHEEIHAKQFHSADILFFEVVSIINWFNPIVYYYKKSARYIHEFIADEVASKEKGKTEYAFLLVSNVFGTDKETLTNNFFNHSLLKKRIMMLHKNKSNSTAILKYGLIVPLFAAMITFSSAKIKKDEIKTLKQMGITIPLADNTVKSNHTINKRLNSLVGSKKDTSAVFNTTSVEIMPAYPGGLSKFLEWVGANYKYPDSAKKAGVSGRMIVQFIIEKDGSLSNVKVVRDLGYGTGEEAKQLLQQSKKWTPGIQNGKPVRVQYTLPLALKINSGALSDTLKTNTNNIFNSSNPPLIILDGKEVSADNMNSINPADIKSINVLKHPQATAVYGKKGENGVIVITLKDKKK